MERIVVLKFGPNSEVYEFARENVGGKVETEWEMMCKNK